MRFVLFAVLGLILSLCVVNNAQASGDPGSEFFAHCQRVKNCAVGDLSVASSVGDSGAIGQSFSFTAAVNSKGHTLWVNFRAPKWMTCSYTDVYGGYHDWANGLRIKKADYISCYWYVTEGLPS